MTSQSLMTHSALFCGIFALFFMEIRSEIISTTKTPVHSVPPPAAAAEVTSPRNTASPAVADVKNVTASEGYAHGVSSTGKKRTASEKTFTQSVSGTERPTHKETSSIATTARVEEQSTALPKLESSTSQKNTAVTTATNAPVLTSGQQSMSNESTDASTVTARNMTTMLPETNTTAFSMTPKSPELTTSFTPLINTSTSVNTTVLADDRNGLATTTAVKETSLSATTAKYTQNTTKREFIQSSATTELSASNATTVPAFVNYTQMTENTKNISTTTESQIRNQSTTVDPIHTTAFSNKSTTIAEIPSTNASIIVTRNATVRATTEMLPTSASNLTKVPETMQNTTAQPCSSFGQVRQCLIVIASLAVVATIFIICTIVLCTKLSSRKYKLKRQQQGTEMMCISSLMPERFSHRPVRYTRQRSPVPNGVLVIHNGDDDSDDEAGDNLTLSSFLPENDRYV